MKRILKVLACVLTFALVIPFAAACGKEEPADITMWVVQIDANAVGINYGESAAFKKLEEISGKKIKMIMGTDYNTLLATNSYPEVIVWGAYPGGYDLGLAGGKIRDLTDLVNEHAPNYKKILTENEDIFRAVSTSDGRIPAMYEINDEIEGPWYGYYMRRDILTAHGYAEDYIPVTYDDWAGIFDKVQKGTAGAPAMKNPLYISPTGVDLIDFLNAGYDVIGGGSDTVKRYVVDGEMKYGPLESNFEEYVTMMNGWYNKGYISKGFSLGGYVIFPSFTDIVGTAQSPASVMAFPHANSYHDVLEATAAANGISGYELVAVPHPRKTGEEDKELHVNVLPGYTGTSMVITDKCTDDQLAIDIVKWFDYLYSKEGSLLMNFGIEGDTYNMVDGKPVLTQKILDDPVFNRYKYASSNFPTLRMRVIDDSLLSAKAKHATEVWSEKNDGSYGINYMLNLPVDKANDALLKETAYFQHYLENIVKFINNGRALREYGTFVNEMNNLGAGTVTALYQNAFEAYDGKQYPASWGVV